MASQPPIQIAFTVESLRQAENLYTPLFTLRVTARDQGTAAEPEGATPLREGWGTGEDDDPLSFRRSFLERNGFRLLLLAGAIVSPGTGRVAHIGLRLPRPELRRMRDHAEALACHVLVEEADEIWIEDPLGVRWNLKAIAEPE